MRQDDKLKKTMVEGNILEAEAIINGMDSINY
jgi:hypothetical protein